jgi:hypothetical protein
MKRLFIAVTLAFALTGCTSIIPSFWDDNQSVAIIDARFAVEQLDCSKPHAPQVKVIKDRLEWFVLYSESKGKLQRDVQILVEPMQETVDDFYKRSLEKEGSKAYCEAKKRIMQSQSSVAAKGILGRW